MTINNHCFVIASPERARLLQVLHLYHQSVDGMIRLIKGMWWWPRMKAQITSMWNLCEVCQTHRQGKEHPPISQLWLRRLLPMDYGLWELRKRGLSHCCGSFIWVFFLLWNEGPDDTAGCSIHQKVGECIWCA